MSDNLSELQAKKAEFEGRHRQTLEAIGSLRQRARSKALGAEATRQPLSQSEIDFWQSGIREKQAELMRIQSELGETNKALKACRDRTGKAHQAPRPNGDRADEETKRIRYLEFFHQICRDSLDPRQFAALEGGAHGLMRDYAQMHTGGKG
jgi:hypothetical protein